jgi:hypothetical protein
MGLNNVEPQSSDSWLALTSELIHFERQRFRTAALRWNRLLRGSMRANDLKELFVLTRHHAFAVRWTVSGSQ